MSLGQTYHETWKCPACGREVEIVSGPPSMKAKGYWMPPSPRELIAVCASQNRAHRRDGSPLPPPPPPDPTARWRPIERQGDTVIVLVPPAGFALRPAGDGFDIIGLARLEPSDLFGSWDRLLDAGHPAGHVAAADVVFDPTGRMIDWERIRA
jgi:hypothetical protein